MLLSFINKVLEDSHFKPIESLTISNPFNPKTFPLDKKTVLDIKAVDSTGRCYDIEVQSTGDRNYVNRSLYYWARLYSSQLTEGEEYKRLCPVICINLLNFIIFPDMPKIHSCFLPFEIDNFDLALTDHQQIHFIELPKLMRSSGSAILNVNLAGSKRND